MSVLLSTCTTSHVRSDLQPAQLMHLESDNYLLQSQHSLTVDIFHAVVMQFACSSTVDRD